ncbi:hypothetical protein ACOSP6_11075 [Tenacibaculum sp. MEBiC06402]|uniref:hypothetical protein n=1 Tax=unclassified Tenacibaculum TaxID=2635139 RepID=UPI003B9B07E0
MSKIKVPNHQEILDLGMTGIRYDNSLFEVCKISKMHSFIKTLKDEIKTEVNYLKQRQIKLD